VDWQTVNQYAASLVKLLGDAPIGGEVLARDKERLSRASRVGPGFERER
jgi:hypothetical protein